MNEPATTGSSTSYGSESRASLVHAVEQLNGLSNAALRQVFAVVAELTRRKAFHEDGCKDAASWLELRLGLSYRTAARWAEVALALEDLPELGAAFESGTISLDKVAACIRFATPETDAYVADEAKRTTATGLERAARRKREMSAEREAEARKNRGLGWRWSERGSSLAVHANLTAEQGSTFLKGLERVTDSLDMKEPDGTYASLTQRRADALVELAGTRIAADRDPDRATVIVHADLETLMTGIGVAETEQGAIFSSDVLQRLLCDARIQMVLEDSEGRFIEHSYTQRTAPPSLRRVLMKRDETCRFPGCGRTDALQAHHQIHWPKGGPTKGSNMYMYCPSHHGYVHDGRIKVIGDPHGELHHFRPDRSEIVAGALPLEPAVLDWMTEMLGGATGPPSVTEPPGRELVARDTS